MALSTESPRNSRRSLLSRPALRWVSAVRNRPGVPKRYASRGMESVTRTSGAGASATGASSADVAAATEVDGLVEGSDVLEVVSEWAAHLVLHGQEVAAVL